MQLHAMEHLLGGPKMPVSRRDCCTQLCLQTVGMCLRVLPVAPCLFFWCFPCFVPKKLGVADECTTEAKTHPGQPRHHAQCLPRRSGSSSQAACIPSVGIRRQGCKGMPPRHHQPCVQSPFRTVFELPPPPPRAKHLDNKFLVPFGTKDCGTVGKQGRVGSRRRVMGNIWGSTGE